MVSPYPPVRDGIANYAVQSVARLLDEGNDVEVVSPWPSAAHHHVDLRDPEKLAELASLARDRDRLILQFQPEMFRTAGFSPERRAEVYDALASALRPAARSEVRVHEFDYTEANAESERLRAAARAFWQTPSAIEVHTPSERDDLTRLFGVEPARIAVVEHGADFERRTKSSKAEARKALGLPADERMLLAIGFIQPHKGFDRAVRAFDGLAGEGARLDVVGSVRVDEPEWLSYRDGLAAQIASTPGAYLHEGYVSDQAFDEWLVAADAVVLPYRHIWSSGVLERAALYGTPVISTDVGNLAQQAGTRGSVTLVSDDQELAAAMREAVGAAPEPSSAAQPWPAGSRETVTAEVRRRAAAERTLELDPAAPSVRVMGYLSDSLGVGQAARLYLMALQAAGLPVSTISVDPDPPDSGVTRAGRQRFTDIPGTADPDFNLICVNGDQLPRFARELGDGFFAGRTNVGVWAFETDVLPSGWVEAAAPLDEVWVNSRFMAGNLGRLLPLPVVAVPPPVPAPPVDAEDPLGLEGAFSFLFTLDLMSTIRRKNPLGVMEAYRRAFDPGDGAALVIKTVNGELRPDALAELESAAGGREDIRVVDLHVSDPEKGAMLSACGAYVSLHRSEGFGLMLAEAMALGKPVIATGWSGNLDFMNEGNSFLVDSKLVEVGPGDEIYPAAGQWAEPELDHAATLMRRVFDNPEEATRRGERARADIAELLSPRRSGEIARARLERLRVERPVSAPAVTQRELGASFQELQARLDFDLRRGAESGRGGLASVLRRIVLRLMLPFTTHERQLDRALVDALAELDERLRALESNSDRRR